MNARQQRAAFLIARGMTYAEAARAIDAAPRTVEKWMSPAAPDQTMRKFVESEKARMEGDWPEADDVCRMALGAIKKDGSPDWQARLTAARILKMQVPDSAAAGPEAYQVNISFLRDPETGDPILPSDDDIIDAAATEVTDTKTPGHALMPPQPEPGW